MTLKTTVETIYSGAMYNFLQKRQTRERKEIDAINRTRHPDLVFQGGKMSLEMEIPKILWPKNDLPSEKFSKCKFYGLSDFLTHHATAFNQFRSYCSLVCNLASYRKGSVLQASKRVGKRPSGDGRIERSGRRSETLGCH